MTSTHIIDPMFFYWIEILPNVAGTIGFFGLIFGLAFAVAPIISKEEFYYDKKAHPIAIVFFILAFCTVFVPSQDTMYKMALADMATVENYAIAKEEGVQLIEFFKEQVIDIVEATKK